MARRHEPVQEEKFLDINADMQGKLTFKDSVNLKINGSFDGELITKGLLIVGPKSVVTATIDGDEVEIGGRVKGTITASIRVRLTSTARVEGDIHTPKISIEDGAYFHGRCDMMSKEGGTTGHSLMSEAEVCTYLEIDPKTLNQWAQKGKIPAVQREDHWEFNRSRIDAWVTESELRK